MLLAEGNLLAPSLPTLIWAWVTFLVTLWALSKVAWPLLARKMEERELKKSPLISIGTSLAFEAVVVLLAMWSFARKDY